MELPRRNSAQTPKSPEQGFGGVGNGSLIAHIAFEPGQVTTSYEDKIDSTVINIARNAKVGEYAIVAGFQLTKEQLDYNTKMNRYAQ